MPELSTLIPIIPALIIPLATLLGVWITQRNNRKTKLIELEHSRDLKMIEIEDQMQQTQRQEKREVYLEVLRAYRMSVQYSAQLSHMALGQQLQVDIASVYEGTDKFRRLLPELEIVGSEEVRDFFQELYSATAKCNNVMYVESEKRFSPFDQRGIHPSPQQKAAIWEEVSAEVRKVYEVRGMENLYAQLRTQIRKGLGFTSQDTDLMPSPEAAKKLHTQLLNVDQMRLRSGQQDRSDKG